MNPFETDNNPFGTDNKFDSLVPVLSKAMSMAYEIQFDNKKIVLGDLSSFAWTGKQRELRDYLSALEEEMLLDIITIMYIGRDETYKNKYGNYDFSKQRESLEFMKSEGKEIIANQICSKGALWKYLSDGCEKLHIKI